MRKFIARVAYRFGWRTWYHVTCQFPVSGGTATLDLCVSMRPWLRESNMIDLRTYISKQAAKEKAEVIPNITSITRIGV